MMPGTPNQTLADLTEAYMLGLLKDEQVQTLDRLLRQDRRALDQCAESFEIMSMVHEVCVRREETHDLHTHEPLLKDFGQALSESQGMDHDADADAAIQALAELARLHEEGLKQPFDPELHHKAQAQNTIATASKATRLKTKLILTGSLAACIALAGLAVLIVSLFTASDEPIASQTDDAIVVATLTAEHDAVWTSAGGASAPPANLSVGSKLHPGTRLTLIEGFAEITTNDGAIATLEAPATIELLDNNNAIHLHAGKLVGLCHTESSKGFVVKTDHADITDLGTEFGVEARDNRITTTVFTGEVTLTTPGGEPQPLTTHQTARVQVNGNNRRLVVKDQPANGFNKLHALAITKTITLPGTGQATTVGQTAPHWSITAIDGLGFLKPVAATVADPAGFTTTNRENMRFMPNTPASQWITPLPHYKTEQSVTYQTTFDVSGLDLQTVALDLKFLADKQVAEITLNGRPVAVPAHGSGPVFDEMTELTLREGFVEGPNTLSLTVQRYRTPEHAGFWTGLRAELELTGRRLGAGPNE